MRRIGKIFFILLLAGSFSLPAAETGEILALDIQTAVDMALQNNLSLQGSALDLSKVERPRNNLWNNFLPTITAMGTLNYGDNLFSEPAAVQLPPGLEFLAPMLSGGEPWTFLGDVSASLTLNLAIFSGIDLIKQQYHTGLITYETAKQELERNVRKAFYGLLVTRASMELMEKNIDTTEKQYRQAGINFSNGLVSELDLLRFQVGLENLRPAYNQVSNTYQNSLMLFKFLLGIDRNIEIELQGDLEVEARTFDPEELIARYREERLDIQALRQLLTIQELLLKVTRQSGLFPSLVLKAGWSTTVNDPFNGDRWKKGTWSDTGSFSATLAIPLDGYIPGSSTNLSIKDKADDIRKTRFNLALARENADIEIINLVMSLSNNAQSIQAYQLNEALAQRAYDMTMEAFAAGTREFLEVESAMNSLRQAQQDVLMAKFNYMSNLLDLEYALNTSINEIISE